MSSIAKGDKITFNTGALYGEKGEVDSSGRSLEGQLIDAVVIDTKADTLLILMVDRSRGVHNVYEISPEDFNQKGIMHNNVYGSDNNEIAWNRVWDYWEVDQQGYYMKENEFDWNHNNLFGNDQ